MIYGGPGTDALRRECPGPGWRLCAWRDRLPPTADDFLWRADGPTVQAGGAKRISSGGGAVIWAAVTAEPLTELRAMVGNARQQLQQFASGDGLQAWPRTVTPVIERDFPRFEAAAYAVARQTRGVLAIPSWLQAPHREVAVLGVPLCCATLPVALRKRQVAAGFALPVLLAVIGNAAITGALSGPHDRYQSRIMWLPPVIGVLATASLARRAQ